MPQFELQVLKTNTKDFPSVSKIEAEMRRATSDIRRRIIADFRKTVETWEHPVTFRSRTDVSRGNLVAYVYTADAVYKYVNDGTRPRVIRAKNKPNLSIRLGFHPKTRTGVIGSTAGRYDGPVHFKPSVTHPGIVARRFSDVIADKYRAELYTALVDAMWRGIK